MVPVELRNYDNSIKKMQLSTHGMYMHGCNRSHTQILPNYIFNSEMNIAILEFG
jgi:hypothetical protein